MVEYVKLAKRKYPFVISMSTLIQYKRETGEDFVKLLATESNVTKQADNLLDMLKLGIKTGFEYHRPPLFRVILNYLRAGNKLGIKEKEYPYMLDKEWTHLLKIVPAFLYDMSDMSEKVVEDIIEDENQKEVAKKK